MNKQQAKELLKVILRIAQMGYITKNRLDTEMLVFFLDQIAVSLNKTPKKKLDLNEILTELSKDKELNFSPIAFNNHG